MKDNIEELLKKALHEGEIPTAALNQEILKKVKRAIRPTTYKGGEFLAKNVKATLL